MSKTAEVENAMIVGTSLGIEDGRGLTAIIDLSGPGWGQGFGGYMLGAKGEGNYAAWFIEGVLKAVGAPDWERLLKRHCRIRRENDAIVAIGHILEDKWFCPAKDFLTWEERDGV